MVKKPRVIHPFLFAIFPILAIYARNVRMLTFTIELPIIVGLTLLASGTLYILLKSIIKNSYKASFLVSLVMLWFFSFGRVANKLRQWKIWSNDEALFIASLLLLTIAFFFIIRSKRSFSRSTYILNIIAISLLALNILSVTWALLSGVTPHVQKVMPSNTKNTKLPNIFFIVLDGYGRSDVLSEVYGLDNSEFIGHLEQKGFYVASQSPANYCQTGLSLACTLNLTYLDELASKEGPKSADRRPLAYMIQSSQVRRILKALGYSFISFPSGFSATEIRDADLFVRLGRSESEFLNVVVDTTPIPLFLYESLNITDFDLHRRRILRTFQALSSFSYKKSPYFVFAHIVSPHPPFVFGKDGEAINPHVDFALDDGSDLNEGDSNKIQEYIGGYRDQLSFINKKIKATLESILAKSQDHAIIILESDHGPKALFDTKSPDASYLRETMAVLNAIYLPGSDYRSFYPGISPLNTLIAVISRITGDNRPLLEDKSFYSTEEQPYNFVLFDPRTYSKTLPSFLDKAKRAR